MDTSLILRRRRPRRRSRTFRAERQDSLLGRRRLADTLGRRAVSVR